MGCLALSSAWLVEVVFLSQSGGFSLPSFPIPGLRFCIEMRNSFMEIRIPNLRQHLPHSGLSSTGTSNSAKKLTLVFQVEGSNCLYLVLCLIDSYKEVICRISIATNKSRNSITFLWKGQHMSFIFLFSSQYRWIIYESLIIVTGGKEGGFFFFYSVCI